jgi:hypothetical protein
LIASPIYCLYVSRVTGIRFNLSTQVKYMNIYGAVKTFEVIAKSLFNKLPPAKNPARFLGENAQQLEFNRGEMYRSTC